jgi:nicotinamidase-related amidase
MEFLDLNMFGAKVGEWASLLGVDVTEDVALESPALIVVDMQNDFLLPEGLLKVWGGPAIIPKVAQLVDTFHEAFLPVFFTRHIYEDPEKDGGLTARWWKVDRNSLLLRESTWHAQLHGAFKPGPRDRVLAKRRYSAFFGTDLELLLRTSGVQDVVIAGVCTNICCEATAHDAFFRDFNVHFLLDGTGATDEAAHTSTLRNIALSYGKLVTAAQVARWIHRTVVDSVSSAAG